MKRCHICQKTFKLLVINPGGTHLPNVCTECAIECAIKSLKEPRMETDKQEELGEMPEKSDLVVLAEICLKRRNQLGIARDQANTAEMRLMDQMKEADEDTVTAQTPDGVTVTITYNVREGLSYKKG